MIKVHCMEFPDNLKNIMFGENGGVNEPRPGPGEARRKW